jgi:hypothetical protein
MSFSLLAKYVEFMEPCKYLYVIMNNGQYELYIYIYTHTHTHTHRLETHWHMGLALKDLKNQ